MLQTSRESLQHQLQTEREKHQSVLEQHVLQFQVLKSALTASNAKVESEAMIRVGAAVSDDVVRGVSYHCLVLFFLSS